MESVRSLKISHLTGGEIINFTAVFHKGKPLVKYEVNKIQNEGHEENCKAIEYYWNSSLVCMYMIICYYNVSYYNEC